MYKHKKESMILALKLWVKEVNKRKNEIENNEVTLVNGDEVFKKISKRLNS